jgi:hypothetical protein
MHLSGGRSVDHLLAEALVQLRQDLAVDPLGPERQPRRPLAGGDLFQKVGDIGGVQRLHQRVDGADIAGLQRLPEFPPQSVVERIGVAPILGRIRLNLVCLLVHSTRRCLACG